MATYQIQGPNGEQYHIDGPDDADPSDVISQVAGAQHHFSSGQQMDAIGGQSVPSNSAAAIAARSPLGAGTLQVGNPGALFGVGPSSWDTGIQTSANVNNYLAGAGKAPSDIVHGVGQDVGLVSRQDVANSNALDAPLMSTTAGKFGYGTGLLADLAPAAWIPGAGTLAGAAAIGAGTGLIQPSASTNQTLWNVGLGGVTGPAAILGGRALGATYQGAKGLLEPLFQGGQQRIAARALQSFAGGSDAAANTADTLLSGASGNFVPGIQPTTAELANNAGLSQLTRTLRNNPQYAGAFAARDQANQGAMTSALRSISGNDADMLAAVEARSNATAGLYAQARDATAPSNSALGSLLQRPSLQAAWQRAQALAEEKGETIGSLPSMGGNSNPNISGREIQYLKMSLNDMINQGPQSGMGAHELGAMKDTLSSLNDWTQANIPTLRIADSTFKDLSAPINQMEVGQALTNKLLPALADFGGNTRLNAAAYTGAVSRNGDALAAQVTGQKNATLDSVLTADQLKTVMQVGEQLARRSNADQLGVGVGSNTAQNIISQNMLARFLSPFGLSDSAIGRAAQSTFGQSIVRPAAFVTKLAEPRVTDILGEASLDPIFAARLLSAGVKPGMAHMAWARQGLLGPLANSAVFTSQK
jgi:hypothetical protein